MKVRVHYSAEQMQVDEIFEGTNAEAIVRKMQQTVAGKLNFAMRLMVNAMSPTQFAQEVVKRYNGATRKNVAIPQNCDEFLTFGQAEGIVTFLEG